MTTRDELIEQAARTIHDAHRPTTGPIPAWEFEDERWRQTYRDMAASLVDAGWRPPPSGDVIHQAASVLARRMFEIDSPHISHDNAWDEADHDERAYVMALSDSLADAGYLATHSHDCAQHPKWATAHREGREGWLIGQCRCENCRMERWIGEQEESRRLAETGGTNE